MSRPRLEGARNFANKIWNAARFVLGVAARRAAGGRRRSALSRRRLARPGRALDPRALPRTRSRRSSGPTTSSSSARPRGCCTTRSGATTATGTSSWPRSGWPTTSAGPGRRRAIWSTLTWVLDRYLRLLHPIMPHLTEEIWGRTAAPRRRSRAADRRAVADAADAAVQPDADQAEGVAELIEPDHGHPRGARRVGRCAADWLRGT